MNFRNYSIPYKINPEYSKSAVYFSMEFAVDQALKTYSGGLGFLAGSHMRSAYNLKQNLVGIGILWKYGYYDQGRNEDQTLKRNFIEKSYSFLEDTGIKFQIKIGDKHVWVTAKYLNPKTFGTAPLFFLTTDLPENDEHSRSISHRLYDADPTLKLSQFVLLGKGGAKLLDEMGLDRDIYHLNEAHGLPAAFYLLDKFKDVNKVKEKLVFTTHTPEEAGNEKHPFDACYQLSYFSGLSKEDVFKVTGILPNELFNHSLAALRLSHIANGVSKLHGVESNKMWGKYPGICEIKSITNAQDYEYWAEKSLYYFANKGEKDNFDNYKKMLKASAFKIVADQCGKLFDPNVLTIVWARRFAGYKRADMLLKDMERFDRMMKNAKYPVQVIWAGKPYPFDYTAVDTFNMLVRESAKYPNMAVVTGYELALSRKLKEASDIWLNTPRVPREASGTSGMTAAMNASVNFSTFDGWIPEFAKDGVNSFIIPQADYENITTEEMDRQDLNHMYDILENEIIPTYYEDKNSWRRIVQQGMKDVKAYFISDRLAHEYYKVIYNAEVRKPKMAMDLG